MSILRAFSRQIDWHPCMALPLLIGAGGAFLLITGAGWTLGYRGVWAFSHLTFVSPLVRWGMGLTLLLVTLFAGHQVARQWWNSFATMLGRIPAWVWLLLFATLFWSFRERSYQGDALLKLHLLSTETLQSDPYVWKEPLDSFSARSLAGLLHPLNQPPEIAVALLSSMAGVLYVGSVLFLARVLGDDMNGRIAIVVSLLALGSTQLWFGHIENYSLVTALTIFSIALAISYLRGRTTLWPVGLVAGAAVSFHPQAIFTLPALAILLDGRWLSQGRTLLWTGLIVPSLTVALFWLLGVPFPSFSAGYSGDPQLFWTVAQIFEAQRMTDALNNLWLLVPFLPLSLLVVVAMISVRQSGRDRVFVYLSVLITGLLIYFFAFQNDLARHRDWDLFAIVGPGLALWTVYGWLKISKQFSSPQSLSCWNFVWFPALLFALLFTSTWIGVNSVYQLIRPNANERELFEQYRILDLSESLDAATVMPNEPICGETVGCERVARTQFTMPQNGDMRPVIFAHAPVEIVFPIQVPEREAFIWLSPALDPEAWTWEGDGVTFHVVVQHDQGEQLLWSRHLRPDNAADLGWQETLLPLDSYLGQNIRLVLRTLPGPANNSDADRAGWGLPWLMGATLDSRYDE